jgi:hypothetical protein
MRNWLNWASLYRKKLFFFYGADSVLLSGKRLDESAQEAQQRQISRLWDELQELYTMNPHVCIAAPLARCLTDSDPLGRLQMRLLREATQQAHPTPPLTQR